MKQEPEGNKSAMIFDPEEDHSHFLEGDSLRAKEPLQKIMETVQVKDMVSDIEKLKSIGKCNQKRKGASLKITFKSGINSGEDHKLTYFKKFRRDRDHKAIYMNVYLKGKEYIKTITITFEHISWLTYLIIFY